MNVHNLDFFTRKHALYALCKVLQGTSVTHAGILRHYLIFISLGPVSSWCQEMIWFNVSEKHHLTSPPFRSNDDVISVTIQMHLVDLIEVVRSS